MQKELSPRDINEKGRILPFFREEALPLPVKSTTAIGSEVMPLVWVPPLHSQSLHELDVEWAEALAEATDSNKPVCSHMFMGDGYPAACHILNHVRRNWKLPAALVQAMRTSLLVPFNRADIGGYEHSRFGNRTSVEPTLSDLPLFGVYLYKSLRPGKVWDKSLEPPFPPTVKVLSPYPRPGARVLSIPTR